MKAPLVPNRGPVPLHQSRSGFTLSPRHSGGFALVIVLATLVLLVVLAIGFLVRATTERAASSGARSASSARLLADTTVSLVQSQIRLASTQGSTVAWASQPGLVRTFSPDGNALHGYKLYSSPTMVSVGVDTAADAPPADWAKNLATWTDLNAPVAGTYPILDPSAVGQVEGFSVTSAPIATYPSANPIPMPVQWLYVLRDGTMVAPTGSGNTALISGDSTDNPIVGRVAFWTDDDTCKVNINTASEGTYWDTPRADTTEERTLATHQPVQKEFQRYPGHPAMTSLSAVFPNLTYDQIYAIVPRVHGGGSDAGNTRTVSQANSTSGAGGSGPAGQAIVPDNDRLYASVDELAFNPARASNPSLNKTQLERAKFFLTARSRAPETNLFNLPRIAIWPIAASWGSNPSESNVTGMNKTSAFDRLIAFCSSLNGKAYYFQRASSTSQSELTDITRNAELYSYLQSLTGRSFPGFGGNFLSKYSSDRDQILTEIFDYIRAANLTDETLAYGNRFTRDFYPGDPNRPLPGNGQITPTVKGSTMGFGRMYTLSELAIAFICTADYDFPETNENGSLKENEIRVQALIIPEFFSPMMGYAGIMPNMIVNTTIDTMSIDTSAVPPRPSFSVNNVSIGFQPSYQNTFNEEAGRFGGGSTQGGGLSWKYFKLQQNSYILSPPFVIDKTSNVSPEQPLPCFSFGGGKLRIQIKAVGTANPVQNITLKIPDGVFPMPVLAPAGNTPLNYRLLSVSNKGRFYSEYATNLETPLIAGDVVRSVVPADGDYRLIAGRNTMDDTIASPPAFAPHPYWNTISTRVAASLAGGATDAFGLDNQSTYFPGITYSTMAIPDIVPGYTIPNNSRDFDTGVENSVDGAYINKPDQGNTDAQNGTPYFETDRSLAVNTTFFSPNRQIPSPGMFGSLPTGVIARKPWQTLLFRPDPNHPSASTTIPDHLFMDLFWMPVVEPYAISETFATAGKINLNYQILPFTYITRSTGINALLKSEKIAAIPISAASTYKVQNGAPGLSIRLPIDVAETLKQFTEKFADKNVFRSASEITDIHIVPTGETVAGMPNFWESNRLTGENLREHIYTTLYPRLTTKSNTYTVHFRAQALSKLPSSAAGTWTEGRDNIAGEYRGSTTIERYIDGNNPNIPDYGATPNATPTLDTFYRWRTVENKQFAP